MISSKFPNRATAGRQRGAALAVSLIFLLVLTLIGITAMSDTTLQERMAGNLRDGEIAFQAAESALRDAETEILVWTTQPGAQTSAGSCSTPRLDCPLWDPDVYDFADVDGSVWQNVGIEYGAAGTQEITTAHADPLFVIEEREEVLDSVVVGHQPPTSRVFYQVTARSAGGSENAVSIIQTSVAKRYN